MKGLMSARSIAVVGASPSNGVTRNIFSWADALGGKVEYWPVNPKYQEVAGRPCYPSLAELPDVPDVVAAAVSPGTLPQVIEDSVGLGAKGLVAYSDLRRSGPGQEERVQQLLRSAGVALVGSNCMGGVDVRRGIALYSGDLNSRVLETGGVGFVSHSGSILIGMMSAAPRLRLSSAFSVGNEDATTAAEYLRFMAEDDGTTVIGMFLETIRNPDQFRESAALAASLGKPVVALTVGKSQGARANAATHSGALAPDAEVMSAFLEDLGIVEVPSTEALIETLVAFQTRKRPRGARVGMVHVSGGQASVQLDLGHRVGLEFPKLHEQTLEVLREEAPWLYEPQNPLDTWGARSYTDSYPPSLRALRSDDVIDVIVANQDVAQYVCDEGHHVSLNIARATADVAVTTDKPCFMISNIAVGAGDEVVQTLTDADIPLLLGAEQGTAALARWVKHYATARDDGEPVLQASPVDLPATSGVLDEVESLAILAHAGLAAPAQRTARDEAEAFQAARHVGYPVVLKVVSSKVVHKSDNGGVITGVRDDEQLREAWTQLTSSAAGEQAESFLVVHQVEKHRELLLGAHHDPQLGMVVLLGAGGVMTEVISDVQMAMAPVSRARAEQMVDRLRCRPWLSTWRNLGPADTAALCEAVVRFSAFVSAHADRIDSVDVNPLAVMERGGGVLALDAVVVLT